ncbi:MAG: hypothetical protein RXQ62_02775 [Nitrososphaeria archaeon]
MSLDPYGSSDRWATGNPTSRAMRATILDMGPDPTTRTPGRLPRASALMTLSPSTRSRRPRLRASS